MKSFQIWTIIFLAAYISGLAWSIFRSRKLDVAGPLRLPALLGMTTFVATVFSTFTLLGMPDFFRNHGVGAWIFLGVTDVAMAFLVLWFGLTIRRYQNSFGFTSLSEVLTRAYGPSSYSRPLYLAGIFIFLIPYVAIQLGGISAFFHSLWGVDEWVISLLIMATIFSVIHLGGFGAIVRSDVAQWVILFVTIWVIGLVCLDKSGGFQKMLAHLQETNPQWLSTPGPKGLFNWQFLLASFIAIVLMPISQPQLSWRVASFDSENSLRLGAVGIAVSAFLVILPTLFIGAYGAIFLSGASAPEFWKTVLVTHQTPIVGALAVVGLLAAAMSTADSQLHSLRREFLTKNSPETTQSKGKFLVLLVFFLIAYVFSLVSSNELVLLARVSFAGTALLAPMVLIAFLSRGKTSSRAIPAVTLLAMLLFLGSMFGWIPQAVFSLRMDLLLIVAIFVLSFLFHLLHLRQRA